MSSRRLIAAGVLRGRRWCSGSALPEPSSQDVYEGRLAVERSASVGVNFLDLRMAAPLQVRHQVVPEAVTEMVTEMVTESWVPWCSDCRLEPVGGPWTLGGAEHLARIHDALHHGGAWTAQAWSAVEVARLVAGGAR